MGESQHHSLTSPNPRSPIIYLIGSECEGNEAVTSFPLVLPFPPAGLSDIYASESSRNATDERRPLSQPKWALVSRLRQRDSHDVPWHTSQQTNVRIRPGSFRSPENKR
jgi:hypothetical protein